jgi:hypothetical protein
MKPTILTTQHTKLTHLHSHLLLPPHTGKRSKSKRECKQPHPFTADQTVNNVDNSVYIQQRKHFGQTEGQLITAVWQKWRFSADQTVLRFRSSALSFQTYKKGQH